MHFVLAVVFTLVLMAGTALGQFSVFPNASEPGTTVTIKGPRPNFDDIMITLNGVSMPVLEILDDHNVLVQVPDTHSGWPIIFVDDKLVAETENQLFVLEPIYWQPWVPTPIITPGDITAVSMLEPHDTDILVLELEAGDIVAVDLVALSSNWYPYEVPEPCPVGASIWPVGIHFKSTTTRGPVFWEAPDDGIYVISYRSSCPIIPVAYMTTVTIQPW